MQDKRINELIQWQLKHGATVTRVETSQDHAEVGSLGYEKQHGIPVGPIIMTITVELVNVTREQLTREYMGMMNAHLPVAEMEEHFAQYGYDSGTSASSFALDRVRNIAAWIQTFEEYQEAVSRIMTPPQSDDEDFEDTDDYWDDWDDDDSDSYQWSDYA